MGKHINRVIGRDPLSGEKVDRRIQNRRHKWRTLEENYRLAAETGNPGAWLEDRIAEADLLEDYLQLSADRLMREADRVRENYLDPGHLGRMTDAGRSRKGVQIMTQASHALEDFLHAVHRNPSFRELVANIAPLEKADRILPRTKYSRIATNLQLVNQAGKLLEKQAEIRVLRRQMRLYSMALLGEIRTQDLAEKMDKLVAKAMDFAQAYSEPEGRLERSRKLSQGRMTPREKRLAGRLAKSRRALSAKRKMEESRKERKEVEALYEG